MANTNAALTIINLTPLPLEAHRKAPPPPTDMYGRPKLVMFPRDPPRLSLGAVLLKPFEQITFPWDDAGVICVSLPALLQIGQGQFETLPALCVFTKEVRKDSAASQLAIDSDFVRTAERAAYGYENFKTRLKYLNLKRDFLKVVNSSGRVANVYLLDKDKEHHLARLEKGQLWTTDDERGQFYQFREPDSNEIIGMYMIAGAGDVSYNDCVETFVLTDTFLEGRRQYQARQAAKTVTVPAQPAQLIGQKRQSTPAQDDQLFITANTVREEFISEPFNGLRNRVVRDVEIAGPTLIWNTSNPVLATYFGKTTASDFRTLTICADTMVVETGLHFPGTNVIIHARELIFNKGGSINTTPLPHAADRAESKFLTVDPDDQTNAGAPANEDGEPTYQAADGANGESGGNITLYVHRISLPDDAFGMPDKRTTRFTCRGGKGQAAEPGGLKKYQASGGAAEVYGKTSPVLSEQLKKLLDHVGLFGPWTQQCVWPGGVSQPEDIPVDQFWAEDVVGQKDPNCLLPLTR